MSDPVFSYADPNDPPVKRKLIRLVEAATGQRKLKRIYMEQRRDPVPSESFFQSAVRRLAIDVLYDARALAAAPRTGPLVVVGTTPTACSTASSSPGWSRRSAAISWS